MKIITSFIIISAVFYSTINLYSQNNIFLKDLKTCKQNVLATAKTNTLEKMDSCYLNLKLPNFSTKTIEGNIIDTKNFKNKVVVINIWSVQCGPCIAELPGLNQIVEMYKNDNILFVALTNERKDFIQKFLAKGHENKFQIIPNAKKIFYKKMDSFGFPRTIVVDKNGIIRKAFSGGVNSKKSSDIIKEKLIPIIDKLLSE